MTFEQWASAAGTIGVPAVILAAMGFAAWKAGWWMATEVIKPVSTRHIEFLNTLEAVVDRIATSSSSLCDQMNKQSEKHETHGKQVLDRLDSQGRVINEIHQIVRK